MATVKKSKKKKIVAPICIVLVIAIIVGSVFAIKAKNSATEVSLTTISTDNIVETVSATGDVSAGASREYKAGTVATCKEVFVKVGDEVKSGDVLATFDTEALDSQITSLQNSYNNASKSYNKAVASEKTAESKLKTVNKQIASLEKTVAKLEKSKSTATTTTTTTTKKAKSETTTKKSTTTVKANSSSVNADLSDITIPTSIPNSTDTSGIYDDLNSISKSLQDIANTIAELTDNVETMNKLLQVLSDTITQAIESGDYNSDSIAQKCGDAMADAIQKGLIDETTLIVESGVAVDMVEAAVKAIDWEEIVSNMENTDSVQLTSAQLQLAALYAEREIFTVSSDSTVSDAQKQVMDTTKSALDVLKDSKDELAEGWVASMDGTVTECNLVAGAQTTALETGIKLENMDSMVVTISLGEYDVHKVKVGMDATIKTAYGQYTGEVATIAPTATGGSESSLLDSVGSMAGISGLSSLTSSGAGVECTITVDDPDENIIIGFEASVDIQTGDYEGVPTVPIESIVLEKEGTYVYLYNEEEGTVTKTQIETGSASDTAYEVTSGLSVGDKIVSTPASDYEEETFKVRVK
jgi:multidrug efflux pump subunit AcrA (membrane-fusion protein)